MKKDEFFTNPKRHYKTYKMNEDKHWDYCQPKHPLLKEPPLKEVWFRTKKPMSGRERILGELNRCFKDYSRVEECLGERVRYKLRDVSKEVLHSSLKGEEAANLTRMAMGLKLHEPIYDLCGLLEDHGIKVGELQVEGVQDFFGLSVGFEEDGPAIWVNTWDHFSVERWIFSAAYELAHLVMYPDDYDANILEETEEQQKQAAEFACYFLMPREAFKKHSRESRGFPFFERVVRIKRMFGLSYKNILHRIVTDFDDPTAWSYFHLSFKDRHGKILLSQEKYEALQEKDYIPSGLFPESHAAGEPDRLSAWEFRPARLKQLVHKAMREHHFGVGMGAAILGVYRNEVMFR